MPQDLPVKPVDYPGQPPGFDQWRRDCWFVEVMPPTWAWAYGRLLNADQPEGQFRAVRLP